MLYRQQCFYWLGLVKITSLGTLGLKVYQENIKWHLDVFFFGSPLISFSFSDKNLHEKKIIFNVKVKTNLYN